MIFQTMNSVRQNNLSLKYHKFTLSGLKDIENWKFEFLCSSLSFVFILFSSFCVSSSFGMLWMWMSELMPTTVRNAGVGSASMIARVGGVGYTLIISEGVGYRLII